MAHRIIAVSIDDRTFEILEEIKRTRKYGIVSQIFKRAVLEESGKYETTDLIKKKLREAEERKSQAEQEIKSLREIQTKLTKDEEEAGLIKISEEMEESKGDDKPSERLVLNYAEIISKHWQVDQDSSKVLADEYFVYVSNCKKTNEKPLNVINYMKGKDLQEKQGESKHE